MGGGKVELRSPAILAGPQSARRPRPSSGVGVFLYNGKCRNRTPSDYRGRGPRRGDAGNREQRPLTTTGLSQETHKAEHSTCQFRRVRFEVVPQELDDAPVFHPRRHHGTFFIIHHDPDQLQHVRVRQALPRYDLPAEILQTVRLGRGGKRSKIPTFFTFRISPDS